MKIILDDESGNPRDYTYERTVGAYNNLIVDELTIKADGDSGQPYIIKLIESDNEVRVMYQDRNNNPVLAKKNIFGSMLPILYNLYNKPIVSSSLVYPVYPNEQRVPETAGKMYKKLLAAGIVWVDHSRDVYYYKSQ